ncbi:hypothetical protein IFM89_003889 [Coptis chinensis]|uniref:Uncharacterized protein n=1 Tax=Coptis chinensis TaxID=261450 RepID=A0A835HZZ3_9MAGN|nr:hypothetical protein IFM89_003889 [Coptis chinensis]
MVVNRDPKFTNFVEFRTHKVIYRRYAGLFFSMCVDITDNELALFVEILDHFFSNYFCELDLVFNFHKVYLILDEFILAGELQETSKKVCDTVFRILISELYQTNCLCPDINLRVHSRIGRLVLPKACAELHECFGSALGAMGPKRFLVLLPLNLEAKDPSKANVWLFPILKQYTVGASLSFFGKSILGKVGELRQKSQMLEQEGQIYSSRSADALIYPLWSLLPAFCNYPLDTASSFKDLKKGLCDALRDEPDVRGIICLSLQILIQQNKSLLEEKNDMLNDDISIAVQRAKATYTPQVAAENLNALKLAAHEFLSVLSGVFVKSTTDSGGCVQAEKDAKRKAKAKELKKLRKAKEKAQAQAVLAQNAPSVSHNQRAIPGIKTEPRTSKGVQLSKEEELKMAQVAEREKRAAAAEKRIAAAAALSA